METLKVFISSTWIDLVPEREAIEQSVQRLHSTRFIGMEFFGAHSESTRDVSLAEVDRSDIYVGIFGYRYGSGITEQEYRRAQARGLPCLIYVKNGDDQPLGTRDPNSTRLRDELQRKHTVVQFRTAEELAARVVADLHNVVFDRLIVQGMGQLRADYDARIQRFLAEYLGTAERPIAFGGRDRELQALDRWLADRRNPPYALLAGPAGRGKSALLVHWAQQLTPQPDVSVIFFPISVRFETNTASVAFASLAARLAAFHGEPVPGAKDTPAEVWRTLLSSYLRRAVPKGRRIVLIIDGADESAAWDFGVNLFPIPPPDGLKVLVSARYLAGDADAHGWLERLGWTNPRTAVAFDLVPLTPQGVVQVLRHMSVPLEALSARADIVAELYRLSEGDPLLVNLYVADLWTRGEAVARLRPEDLAGLSPGLAAYFRRWLDDQRVLWGARSPLLEPVVNAVLHTLACALGPLLTAELLELMPPESGVAVWSLNEALRSLQRFVIGDGDTQGYAFGHPRLGDHFRTELEKAKRVRSQEMRYVSWGLTCLDELRTGRRAAEAVPTYVLQFLRVHMERAGSEPRAFMAFASTAWIAAWERLDRGSYTGYMNDLRAVGEIAAREDEQSALEGRQAQFMADELRCALYESSIASIATDVPLDALIELVRKEVWSPAQAIAYATRIADPGQRMRTLLELVSLSVDAYRPLALAAAAAEARTLLDADDGRLTLALVIRDLATRTESTPRTRRLFTAAYQLAQQLPVPHDAWMLSEVAKAPNRHGIAPEHLGAAVDALAAFLPPNALNDYRTALHEHARELARTSEAAAAFPLDRFNLFHQAISGSDDDWKFIDAALRAAVKALASVAPRLARGERDTVIQCAVACVHVLRDADVADAIATLSPWLEPAEMALLVADARRVPGSSSRVISLALLLLGVDPETYPDLASDLRMLANEPPEHPASFEMNVVDATAKLCGLLPESALGSCLDRLTRNWPAQDSLALLARLAAARNQQRQLNDLATRAMNVVDRLYDVSACTDALVALVDKVLPSGADDSFAEWRPAPSRCELALQLSWLMNTCATRREEIADIALRLARHVANRRGKDADLELVRRLTASIAEREEHHPTAPPTVHPADSSGAVLVSVWREAAVGDDEDAEAERVTRLADALSQAHAPGQLAGMLRALAELSPWMPLQSLARVAAEMLQRTNSWEVAPDAFVEALHVLAAPPLFPPGENVLAAVRALGVGICSTGKVDVSGFVQMWRPESLPDLIRQELLISALTTASNREVPVLLLAEDAGLLARPSDRLIGLVLQRIGEYMRSGLERDPDAPLSALALLAPSVPIGLLPDWFTLAAKMSVAGRRGALTALVQRRSPDQAKWHTLLIALSKVGAELDRAIWLVHLAGVLPPSLGGDALEMARAIRDESARLLALCAAMHIKPATERAPLLQEALGLARRVSGMAELSHRLVLMAADESQDNSPLIAEALATAIMLPDKSLRAHAFATLARVLPRDRLAEASRSFQKIGDEAARIRAMAAFAWTIRDRAQREQATEHVIASIAELPSASIRAPAIVIVAPLVPEPRRWTLLRQALQGDVLGPTGFERPELLDALCVALPHAPATLMHQALVWLAKDRADLLRSQTVSRIVPYLPTWLRLPAVSLMAVCDTEIVARVAPYIDESVFARAREVGPSLSAGARVVLERIAAERATDEAPLVDWSESVASSPEDVIAQLHAAATDLERSKAVKAVTLGGPVDTAVQAAAIEVTDAIGDPVLRASTAPYLAALDAASAPELRRQAAQRIVSARDRCVVVTQQALRTSGDRRAALLQDALSAAAAERDAAARACAAAELGCHAGELLGPALDVLWSARDKRLIMRALRDMLRGVDDAAAEQIVRSLARIADEEDRAVAIQMCAPQLRGRSAVAALALLGSLQGPVTRARALVSLCHTLPDESRPAAVSLLAGITADYAWLEALAAVAERWPPTLQDHAPIALAALGAVGDDEFVASWLARLSSIWPLESMPEFVAVLDKVQRADLRAEVLTLLIERRSDVPIPALKPSAHRLPGFHRAVVLGRLASATTPVDAELLAEAMACAARVGSARQHVDALVAMCSGQVPDPVLETLTDAYRRRSQSVLPALRVIAPLLEPHQAVMLLKALGEMGRRRRDDQFADLLFALAQRLDRDALPELLSRIPGLVTERAACDLLCDLVPLLDGWRAKLVALRLARSLTSETYRVQALTGLLPSLPPDGQLEVLGEITRTPNELERFRRLTDALPALAREVQPSALQCAMRFSNPDYAAAIQDLVAAESAASCPPPASQRTEHDLAALERLFEEAIASAPPVDGSVRPARAPAASSIRLTTLLRALRSCVAEVDRLEEIVAALPRLTPTGVADLLRQLPDFLTEDHQVAVLERMVGPLPTIVQEAAFNAACRLGSVSAQRRSWDALVPLLDREMFPKLQGLWSEVQGLGGQAHRATFLARLTGYLPVLQIRAGDEGLLQSIRAVHDAATVWP